MHKPSELKSTTVLVILLTVIFLAATLYRGWVTLLRPLLGPDASKVLISTEANSGLPEKLQELESVIREHPDDLALRITYGVMLENRSIETVPSRGTLVPALPTATERVSTAIQALAVYEEAALIFPDAPQPHTQLGSVYGTWGLVEDARIELELAIELGENSPVYRQIIDTIELNLQGPDRTD